MSHKEKFLELLAKASKDKIVKETSDGLEEKNDFKWKDISGDQLRNYIYRLGDLVLDEYSKKLDRPPTATDFPKDTANLLSFAAQFEPAMKSGIKPTDPDFIACKDPKESLGITFDQIAGQDEAKRQISLQYIYPIAFPSLFGGKVRGLLFYGVPGTGKTLLAKAATAELPNIAFYDPSPGELKGKYEGDTEKNISRVFECAQEEVENPDSDFTYSIIFIDEFDSLAGKGREQDPGMRRSVNTLLQMMDGIKSSENVSVIAATNYPWTIDDAILRRFGAKVMIDLPDNTAREFLIRQSLAEAYSKPSIPKKERGKNLILKRDEKGKVVKWEKDYLKNIDEYGVPLCRREGVSPSTYISKKEIIKFVARLGPSDKGLQIVKDIEEGKKVDPEDYTDTEPMFGYSASDITKVMELAIQNAAYNAFDNGLFFKTKINGEEWYVSTSTPETTVRNIKIEGKYAISEDVAKKWSDKYPDMKIMSKDKYNRLLNFSICIDDIDSAIKSYPTTIQNKPYIEILNYRHQGIVPV